MMLSSSAGDRVCGYRLETTANLIAVGPLESSRPGCGPGAAACVSLGPPTRVSIQQVFRRMRPFPTLWSVRSEPEGSIKGSTRTAYWRSCKPPRQKKRRFPALLQSPSDGLEPSTPTRVHARASSTQFPLQIWPCSAPDTRREASHVSFLMCPFCVRRLVPETTTHSTLPYPGCSACGHVR
jgi:hypothetical protein